MLKKSFEKMFGQNIGIFSVVGALFHQFTLFSLFAFSNLCPLLYAEKKPPNSKDSAVKFFLSPLQSIYMCIFCFFGGAVDRKLGTHFTVILGCLSICIADFLLIISKNFALDFFLLFFMELDLEFQ